ncbi:hypothetical protein GGI04_002473, partial [Coemansia thaxteri]
MWKLFLRLPAARPALFPIPRPSLLAPRPCPCPRARFSSLLDKERLRQHAQDDVRDELSEHTRRHLDSDQPKNITNSIDAHCAPLNERLDPTTMPGLYPDFDAALDESAATDTPKEEEEEEEDDSWYVDPAFAPPSAPLWQRRARENQAADRATDLAPSASLLDLCRLVAQESAAAQVTLLDVADRCEWTEKMLVVRAKSARHMHALAEDLLKAIKDHMRLSQSKPLPVTVDGRESDDWVVVDLGSFVVHIMTPEAHQAFDLESL